jgi:hypothetical protein
VKDVLLYERRYAAPNDANVNGDSLRNYLDGGKDKVMFLTKADLSSPSTMKIKEEEAFDPWEQHGR